MQTASLTIAFRQCKCQVYVHLHVSISSMLCRARASAQVSLDMPLLAKLLSTLFTLAFVFKHFPEVALLKNAEAPKGKCCN